MTFSILDTLFIASTPLLINPTTSTITFRVPGKCDRRGERLNVSLKFPQFANFIVHYYVVENHSFAPIS